MAHESSEKSWRTHSTQSSWSSARITLRSRPTCRRVDLERGDGAGQIRVREPSSRAGADLPSRLRSEFTAGHCAPVGWRPRCLRSCSRTHRVTSDQPPRSRWSAMRRAVVAVYRELLSRPRCVTGQSRQVRLGVSGNEETEETRPHDKRSHECERGLRARQTRHRNEGRQSDGSAELLAGVH